MFKRIISAVICLFLLASTTVYGQERAIELTNPSFEDLPRPGMPPFGWFDCGPNTESPPDVHPNPDPSKSFEVTMPSQHGETYLGMVVRENDTWESVAQRLNRPIEADQCYNFSIYLARSPIYVSGIAGRLDEKISFTTPVKLRVWGGTGFCNKRELLDESELVKNTDWKEYHFKFSPKQRHTYIVFEAFFQTPAPVPPNGNILLDNASSISPMPCDENAQPLVKKPEVDITNPKGRNKTVKESNFQMIARVLNVKEKREILLKVNGKNQKNFSFDPLTNKLKLKMNLKKGENYITVRASNRAGNAKDETTIVYDPPVDEPVAVVEPKPEPKVVEPKINPNFKSLREGETIKIDKLYFDIDSYEINKESVPALVEVFEYLRYNKGVRVEIGGHTNQYCDTQHCETLSAERAKSVVDFLVQKGIENSRLSYKGYGKTKPVTWVKNAKAQKKNQRVEIKILSLGG